MAADVASVDWFSEDSASPLTMSKPAASAVGDVLLAIVIQHNNPSAQTDLTTPTGWTSQSAFDGVLDDGKAWTRVIDGSEPSTWDWPYKSTADVVGAMVRITGADTTPVIVSASTPTTSVTSPIDSPSVTPSGTNDLLISVLADICNGTQLVATVPSGMTSWGLGEVTGHFMSARLASVKLVSGAATGVQTWTSVTPTGITGGTWTIAVKSAGSTPISLADTGSSSEALTVAAATPLADAGSAAEALTASVTAPLADAGSAAQSLTATAGVPLADTASAVDAALAGIAISPGDTGSGADTLGITAAAPLADAGSAAQSLAVTAAAAVADAASAADTMTVVVTLALADTGHAVEAATTIAAVGLTDTGSGVDTATGSSSGGASKSLTDGGAATEVLCVCKRQLRPSTGTTTRPSTGTTARPDTGTVGPCGC